MLAGGAKKLAQDALQKSRDTLATIEKLERNMRAYNRQFHVPRADLNEWPITFASVLGFAWRRLTGRPPSPAPSSPFERFVIAAYESLDPARPDHSWARACRSAVDPYRPQCDLIDAHPEMYEIAPEVWLSIGNHAG